MFRLQVGLGDTTKAQKSVGRPSPAERPIRADARRNVDALLEAALAVFATSGADAPVREIAVRAGVGVGTLYRHFPQRSDLIVAVFRREIGLCADAAPRLLAEYAPSEALARWLRRYAVFVAAKRGLAQALHSGDPAFENLPEYFRQRMEPALRSLLDNAATAGEICADISAGELLDAVARLCINAPAQGPENAWRMISLLVDGLRYRSEASQR